MLSDAVVLSSTALALAASAGTLASITLIAAAKPEVLRSLKRLGGPKKETVDAKKVMVLLRNGGEVRVVNATEDDKSLYVENKVYPKPAYHIILQLKGKKYKAYILDANVIAFYKFDDPDIDEYDKKLKEVKLKPTMTNPKLLKQYIASGIIEKLLGKISVSKTEVLMYFLSGGFFVYMLQYFVLPIILRAMGY